MHHDERPGREPQGRDLAGRQVVDPNLNHDHHRGGHHPAHPDAHPCRLGGVRCDRATTTRSDPYDRSGSYAAHPDADRDRHLQGDVAVAAEHDCRQAEAESRDHQVAAPRADPLAACWAESLERPSRGGLQAGVRLVDDW